MRLISGTRLGSYEVLALTLLAQGRAEEALAEAEIESDEGLRLWALTIVRHVLMGREASDMTLRQLIENCGDDNAYQIAEVYAVRGVAEAAFAWLERAYAQRDAGLAETKLSPRLRSLHGDPRWGRFLKKMGLAE